MYSGPWDFLLPRKCLWLTVITRIYICTHDSAVSLYIWYITYNTVYAIAYYIGKRYRVRYEWYTELLYSEIVSSVLHAWDLPISPRQVIFLVKLVLATVAAAPYHVQDILCKQVVHPRRYVSQELCHWSRIGSGQMSCRQKCLGPCHTKIIKIHFAHFVQIGVTEVWARNS